MFFQVPSPLAPTFERGPVSRVNRRGGGGYLAAVLGPAGAGVVG